MAWKVRLDNVWLRQQGQCIIEATVLDTESGREYLYGKAYTDPADMTVPKLVADVRAFVQAVVGAADVVEALKGKVGQTFDL